MDSLFRKSDRLLANTRVKIIRDKMTQWFGLPFAMYDKSSDKVR